MIFEKDIVNLSLYGVDCAVLDFFFKQNKANTESHAQRHSNKYYRYAMVLYATYSLIKFTSWNLRISDLNYIIMKYFSLY